MYVNILVWNTVYDFEVIKLVMHLQVEEKETRLREEQQSEEQRLQEETKEVDNMR